MKHVDEACLFEKGGVFFHPNSRIAACLGTFRRPVCVREIFPGVAMRDREKDRLFVWIVELLRRWFRGASWCDWCVGQSVVASRAITID